MKYTFETEEEEEAQNLMQGRDRGLVLFQFDQWLRGEIKHNEKPYDEVRETLRGLMSDYNITFD
jgi:hypothetical protein